MADPFEGTGLYRRPGESMRPGDPSFLERLHGTGDALLANLTPEQLAMVDMIAGPAPTLDQTQETVPDETGGQSFLQSFAGLENQPQARPQGFGQGLVQGLGRGLGSAGSRIEAERAKLEAGVKARQAARDIRNLDATKRYQEARMRGRELVAKEEIDRKNRLTPEQRQANAKADALGAAEGKAAGPQSPADKRAEEAERRRIQADQRAADAAERANRTASGNLLGQITDDYRMSDPIKAYTQIRGNLTTATAAAAQNNGLGDLALVFAYQRSLEPNAPNSVREGEVQTAREAVGKLELAKSLPKRFLTGDGFTPEGRQMVLRLMQDALAARRPAFDQANKQFEGRAGYSGVPAEHFIQSFPEDTTHTRASTGYRPKSWQPIGGR